MSGLSIPTGNIYLDKQSGKNFDRPAYQHLLRRLCSGDALYIPSIDRLGHDYDEILEQWRLITRKKSADIVALDFSLLDTCARIEGQNLTGRFVADLVLQIRYLPVLHRRKRRQYEAVRRRDDCLGGSMSSEEFAIWLDASMPNRARSK